MINTLDLYGTLHSKENFFKKHMEYLPKLTRLWAIKQILTNFKTLVLQSALSS